MKDIVFTADRQRELKKELLTMKWDSPEDATRVRVLLDKYTGMFDYGYFMDDVLRRVENE